MSSTSPTAESVRPRKRLMCALRWFGLVLLVGLVAYAGPARLWAMLGQVHPGWLVLAWLLNFPQLGLKALRWQRMLAWQGIDFGYPRAALTYFGALFIGFLTPGRLGEAAKAFTLRHELGVPLARGFSSVVLDRLFDLYLLLSLGTLGVAHFALGGGEFAAVHLALAWAVMLTPLLLLNARVAAVAGTLIGALPGSDARRAAMLERFSAFAAGFAVMRPGRVLTCLGLTVASYTVFFIQCALCARAIGFGVPARDLVLLMAATNLVGFLPISISNLGTREACLIWFLERIEPPQDEATAVLWGLSMFLVLFVGGGLIGFAAWQWAPAGLRRARSEVTQSQAEATR